MTTYELYKFLHVASAIIWVGSGFGLFVMSLRMSRVGDRAGVLAVGRHAAVLGNRLFAPAAISTLLWGVLMVVTEQQLAFTDLWILIGLIGIVVSIIIGAGVSGPTGTKLTEAVQASGPDDPAVDRLLSRMLTVNAVDLVLLFVVVWAMVAKPGA